MYSLLPGIQHRCLCALYLFLFCSERNSADKNKENRHTPHLRSCYIMFLSVTGSISTFRKTVPRTFRMYTLAGLSKHALLSICTMPDVLPLAKQYDDLDTNPTSSCAASITKVSSSVFRITAGDPGIKAPFLQVKR